MTADRFGLVVLFTGEGVRRLLGCAERAGRRDAVISALGRTRLLTRGPKPVRALREVGLTPALVAPTPTTAGVIATLRAETLPGMTLGVQLYSDDNPPLIRFLEEAGATVRTVLPYVYAPDADADRVVELIQKLAGGLVDVLVFTSSPQVDRLVEVAAKRNLQEVLKKGMASTRVAAVGPVLADHLASLGIRVDICPEQGFVMKNLVQLIKKNLVKMEV